MNLTEQEISDLNAWIDKNVFGLNPAYGLKKRGLWYRPNAKGYTDRQSEAGRYTLEEAMKHEYPYDERVTKMLLTPLSYVTSPADALAVLEACVKIDPSLHVFYNPKGLWYGITSQTKVRNFEWYPNLPQAICAFAKKLFTPTHEKEGR